MKSNTFLRKFFWFAFGAFLSASIPHVAYFFRSFEPSANGDWLNTAYWVVSIAIAVSIDVTIFLLSITVANMHRQKKSPGLISSVWVFIAGLAFLSWYMNFKYAMEFNNTQMISSTPVTLFGWTIPDINPIIASAFQALAIAYTWIADKIASDVPLLTANELKAQADELEQIAQQKMRIQVLRRVNRANNVIGWVNDAGYVVKNIGKTFEKAQAPEIDRQPQQEAPTPVQSQLLAEPEPVAEVQEVQEVQEVEVGEEPSVNEAVTEPIPVAETPIVAVALSLPISEPLTPLPQVRITKPLEQEVLTIPGFTTRNTRYTLDDVTYDSLSNVVKNDWRIYRSITLAVLDKLVKQGKLVPYVKLVQCGEKTVVRTIAISDDSARAVYIALGKALPESLRLTASACVPEL